MTKNTANLRMEYRRIRAQAVGSGMCASTLQFDTMVEMEIDDFGCSHEAEAYVAAAEGVLASLVKEEWASLDRAGERV